MLVYIETTRLLCVVLQRYEFFVSKKIMCDLKRCKIAN